MMNEVTLDNILKAAEENGLEVKESKRPGIYNQSTKISLDELFKEFYNNVEFDKSNEKVTLSVTLSLDKKVNNLVFQKINKNYSFDEYGAA